MKYVMIRYAIVSVRIASINKYTVQIHRRACSISIQTIVLTPKV